MSSDLYKSLPLEPNATRMVRLLPDKETNAEIKCELFTYNLTEIAGRKHLYQALSYVWCGDQESSAEQRKEMKLHGYTVPITANLHAALVNLRDYQLERVLWIDAICINQDDLNEKSNQIPLMRTIYAQADRVIVWLGEAFEHGDKALETIRDLTEQSVMGGEGSDTELSKSDREACLKLLQRKWFRRIWVLQEVGVARSIEIMCGSVQINGYTFCEGLSELGIPRLIRPVVYLIRGAQFRPRNAPGLRGSLYIVISLSEQVVKAAVGNTEISGQRIVEVFLQYQDNLPITEEVVKVAAWNEGPCGDRIMEVLLKYRDSLPITEEVVKAVAANEGTHGAKIMKMLSKHQDNLPVTEDVVKAAAGNEGAFAHCIMRVLFEHQYDILINEEMVTAMEQRAGPDRYNIVMGMLFKHRATPWTANTAAGDVPTSDSNIWESAAPSNTNSKT
ncbi:heterokaryon incompatibility protein-domain-containing protein [Aspergillus transmontanensis]|uniref:Heterokaryon incompatibility protein-domain-containing protein n=1 Tax=Aspergillus transmontanensis TaxID=1034304 RepID=A0A5N6VR83_9EURO|nr:heterokaryon incompatibility protein-domain-containing protein [Aspergillus transmontanensis]